MTDVDTRFAEFYDEYRYNAEKAEVYNADT